MKLHTIPYKVVRKCCRFIYAIYSICRTKLCFFSLDVETDGYKTNGYPIVNVIRGRIKIGKNFKMNNGLSLNTIGYTTPCILIAKDAQLIIGSNVGISQTSLIASDADIIIGDNVLMGAGVKVYSSDFHSTNYENRRNSMTDSDHCKSKLVSIGNDVFIGAGTIILKGVSIGEKSIVGAGSVVTKSIPPNEIWAGNPAKMIRKICQV
ncbi:DapH/DapD/GlmU-related protein [uncultured Fibrobacter sp.]|uniref:acyltransferase n=1 Tax=uncultured Fibrobacter sp. TaxID=261512 RepID=UPI002614AD63|nr:acyltransferase [uncultured Fibrobacter sp.]